MDILTTMPPAVALVLGLVLLAWLVLLFLVPFMVEGIRGWTRKSHQELQQINAKLDRLNALLARRLEQTAPPTAPTGPDQAVPREEEQEHARARKEPIISDLTLDPGETDVPRMRVRAPLRTRRSD